MATLKTLADRLDRKAKQVGRIAHDKKIAAADAMLVYLVEETPVDESTAESNWQIGVGQPVSDEIEAYYLGSQGSTAEASKDAAIAAGRAKLQSAKPGQPIYLSNLLPYIRALDGGSSSQHPGNFVAAAVMIGRDIVRTVKLVRMRK